GGGGGEGSGVEVGREGGGGGDPRRHYDQRTDGEGGVLARAHQIRPPAHTPEQGGDHGVPGEEQREADREAADLGHGRQEGAFAGSYLEGQLVMIWRAVRDPF